MENLLDETKSLFELIKRQLQQQQTMIQPRNKRYDPNQEIKLVASSNHHNFAKVFFEMFFKRQPAKTFLIRV